VAAQLREQLPHLRLQMHMGGGNFKKQMKKANESGAQFALILGEDEVANSLAGIKPLRDQSEQVSVTHSDLAAWFTQAL
jgi:histidyl-tRNA synthetase